MAKRATKTAKDVEPEGQPAEASEAAADSPVEAVDPVARPAAAGRRRAKATESPVEAVAEEPSQTAAIAVEKEEVVQPAETEPAAVRAYAIVRSGGKQHRVHRGLILDVEKLPVEEGQTVELTEVLLVSVGDDLRQGRPLVEGAKVVARVVKQARAKKIIVFKYKPKVRYRRKAGHRQSVTRLSIEEIVAG